VVGAGLEIALHGQLEIQPAVARQRVEQVIEEAHPGRALPLPRAVEHQRELHVGFLGGA
jgi:hypothetical protein